MIVIGDRTFVSVSFDSEEEIEDVVFRHAQHLFGEDSILLPKSLIRSGDGYGTIPDGFAIDLVNKKWFVVEAELSRHPFWDHVVRQVSKQLVAAAQPTTRQALVEAAVTYIRQDRSARDLLAELGIDELDVRARLADILTAKPILAIPIDNVSQDYRDWAKTLQYEVKLWIIRKFVDFNDPTSIIYEIPDENQPAFETLTASERTTSISTYGVGIGDLIKSNFLEIGQKLTMPYGPRGQERQVYEAFVTDNGDLRVGNRDFSSPSYAALHCIQNAGSTRRTVNGWTSWSTEEGRLLADLRTMLLDTQQDDAQQSEPVEPAAVGVEP